MDDKKKEHPDNKVDKNKKPLTKPVVPKVKDKADNPFKEEPKSKTPEQQNQTVKKEDKKVVIENKKQSVTTADKIAFAGLIVNVLLAVFTYLLFREATNSTKTANEAVAEARRSNSISEINYALAKDAFDESKKSGQEATQLANKSLETQIGTLKENQKQFNISNEPFLSIASSNIELFEVGKPLLTKIKIENLGNYPCKVIECKTIITIRLVPPDFKEVYKIQPSYSDILNIYILHDNPVPSPFGTTVPLNENQVMIVKKDNYFVFLTGYIKYQNIISKKIKTYKFQLKMKPGYETENIINENVDD
ncbi:MAG: hypothetical protein EPN39_10515 [Chitinophagaceae bacterium]|nr:MAG: hypothetical protein EPN39_10515 [Chitinophagaceae bacterium]